MTVPDGALLLGTYKEVELFHQYFPLARYSDRAVVYIYAKHKKTAKITFTQVSTIRRSAVEHRDEHEIERWLTIDAVSRAKWRILEKRFDVGEAYTMELREEGAQQWFQAA